MKPPVENQTAKNKRIVIARVGKPHGVRGWMRIISFTDPPELCFTYSPWSVKKHTQEDSVWQSYTVTAHKPAGKYFIAKLEGCDDCDKAQTFTHASIAINRTQLPALDTGDYYWCDLENLTVLTTNGKTIGQVDHLLPTGSNDVLVVKDPQGQVHLIPYIDEAVKKVCLQDKHLIVDENYIVT